ncbi:predicted protein [Sclerotinia sclerotiorum 1980 UF-70]|uniref:Uncharacterized protein n=1 Tax=Sclerotinia sclerotiorum (strain ATCC 18683 / 1980 / Ss-1) TaxID=665079 RepID=A7F316_SCLS1|nr:predicted protein [Sclerotinia sclerotiorum 1980 UF-70]EDN96108.1 predicted protein [Sclerotinia sclerotiorum 1980 UF-70]
MLGSPKILRPHTRLRMNDFSTHNFLWSTEPFDVNVQDMSLPIRIICRGRRDRTIGQIWTQRTSPEEGVPDEKQLMLVTQLELLLVFLSIAGRNWPVSTPKMAESAARYPDFSGHTTGVRWALRQH